jgi:uncharacterized protein
MNLTVGTAAVRRALFATLGILSVALGIIGVFVPGLPTTVFVIAASYCFSRSSPRFERWLRANRWLGPPLQRFSSAGGMTTTAKRTALLAMWIAVLISSALLLAVHWAASAGTIALGAVGTAVILFSVRTVPDTPGAPASRTTLTRTGVARH